MEDFVMKVIVASVIIFAAIGLGYSSYWIWSHFDVRFVQ